MKPLKAQPPALNGARLPDFDLDSEQLGPSTRILMLESDPQGGIFYQFSGRPAKSAQLPPRYGSETFVLIDMTSVAVLLEPQSHRLRAVIGYLAAGTRLFLFGRDWGTWLDENGVAHRETDIPATIRAMRMPITLLDSADQIGVDFTLNVHNREAFSRELLVLFREAKLVRHSLMLIFNTPSGDFAEGRLTISDTITHRILNSFDARAFPLQHTPPAPPRPAPRKAGPKAADKAERSKSAGAVPRAHSMLGGTPRPSRLHAAAPPSPKPAPAAPPPEPPLPTTEGLPTTEVIRLIREQTNDDRRWKLIEANLLLGRPERTYPLVTHFAELIADRTREWPVSRLRTAFANQPGAVLIGIAEPWDVDQVLAVCEVTADTAVVMDWLREHELERLLKLDLEHEPRNSDEARQLMRVGRSADAATIKKVWRVLLGFMNADIGRQQERAIHRKKDEIAKLLQTARNLLIEKTKSK